MSQQQKKSLKDWIDILSQQELPAITSVACTLDRFSNDDKSSIPSLSKAILHDQTLSASLLKVVNNMPRSAGSHVNTISRASTILGIQTVKNICMTAKILDNLLASKNLTPVIHSRLSKLMANAFYAGLLSKMMLPQHGDDTKEEVYLASMLYHIGETAFWSMPSKESNLLCHYFYLPEAKFQKKCAAELGFHFSELTAGLVEAWKLNDLMIKSQDKPESRSLEIQSIFLANELSDAISKPPNSKSEFDNILKRVSRIMNVDVATLVIEIEQTRTLATHLLSSYGASVLEKHIKALPEQSQFSELTENSPFFGISKERAILECIQSLTKLTYKSKDVNSFLRTSLQTMAQVIGFERTTFWIINKQQGMVESRSAYNKKGQAETFKRSLVFKDCINLISHVIDTDRAILVNDYKDEEWCDYISEEIKQFVETGTVCFAPVKIEGKTVGIISAQRFTNSDKVSEDDFSMFNFLIEHLNICLSLTSYHK
jgi:HD-like signal output (HDOD) protein